MADGDTQVGSEFTISGMTTSLTIAVRLHREPRGHEWFKRPVEIVDSQVQTDAKTGDLVKFSIKARSRIPKAPAPPPRGGRGRGPAGRAGEAVETRTFSGRKGRSLKAELDVTDRQTRYPWNCRSANFPGGARSAPSSWCAPGRCSASGSSTWPRCQADIALRQTRLTALRADIDKGVATARRLPEFESQVDQLEQRLESLKQVLPEEKDVADILRRIQGLATQSNLSIQRFPPLAGRPAGALRRDSVPLQAEGTYHNLGLLLRSHQQVPANHQRQRHRDAREDAARAERHDHRRVRGHDVRAAGGGRGHGKKGARVVPKQPSVGK